ncbi:MAG TPA: hypothetical protein VH372_00320 [Actinospica sp.]|jgi:hypothetical protein|nr:hypothetical protein [Actinospica sp.]
MALIVLGSDKGSPGVTTSAVALAAVWPGRALYAECDPHGGDLVYRMPAEHGGPLDPNRGLVSLAVGARRGFDATILPQHTQRLRGGLELLVGLGNAEQSQGMTGLWGPLGRAFDRYGELPYGADVIADCGRLGPDSPTLDLIAQSALVLLIARTEAESLAHVRDRANSLSARLHSTQGSSASLGRPPIGIVLIAPPNRARQVAKQVGDLLAASTAGAEVLGVLAYDESGAQALAGRGRGRVDKALLTRSARELAGAVVHRYGLIRPAGAHAPAPMPTPMPSPAPSATAPPTIPIDPSAVHRAGSQGVPAMPPNLTSVPHPHAYQSPYGGQPTYPQQPPYPQQPQSPNGVQPQQPPPPQGPNGAQPPQDTYPGQQQPPQGTNGAAQNPYATQHPYPPTVRGTVA